MNNKRFANLSDDDLQLINEECEAYESELRSKAERNIKAHLEQAPEQLRGAMLRELLCLEIEYRSGLGETPLVVEYEDKYSEYADDVRQVFALQQASGGSSGSSNPDEATYVPGADGKHNPDAQAGIAGTQIGRYRLLHEIGTGGMGEVWAAQQEKPVQRTVALKIIKAGFDTREVIARFDAERQALAMMDHSNIAKVLDGGSTEFGRPYFVMELVDGEPITDYCDRRKLTAEERMKLFVFVCDAVQHAHQKGIIHRDIKPSNVMVSVQDGQPIVKVIDFGLAKATDQRLTDKTLFTSIGQMVGTPAYMSPEQANPGEADVDTRTDVYSLGALLYELLTGLRPIDSTRLQNAAAAEMVRIIQEEEPTKPSSRISSEDSLPSLSAVRRTEPRKLMSMLRGELDWVVMKCLEKDRDRRYGTANALACDIRRYLNDEPVEAKPPSRSYRFSKFLKRNKGTATAASLVVLALIAGIIGTSYGLMKAERARVAESRRADAETVANEQAQKRLGQLTQFNDILSSIFVSLDPRSAANDGRPLQAILVDQLGEAAAQLDADSIGDPLVVAEMQATLGESLLALSSPAEAIILLKKSRDTHERILGANDQQTVTTSGFLANAYLDVGEPEVAVPMLEGVLQRREQEFGIGHTETSMARNNLALGYQAQGRHELAVSLLEEAVPHLKEALGPEHLETLTSLGNLAAAYEASGRPEKAVPLFEEALRICQNTLGIEHPDTLLSMNNLAFGYEAMGDFDQALPMYEGTLPLMKKVFGIQHTTTLAVMGNLGDLYQDVGEFDLALPLLKQAYEVSVKHFGKEHPDTVNSMSSLASIYQATGQVKEALSLFIEVKRQLAQLLGDDHFKTLMATNDLAMAHRVNGQLDVALPLLESTLERLKVAVGDDHPTTLTCMGNLAVIYQDTGKVELAVPLYEMALAKQKETLGDGHPDTFMTMNNLATAYWAMKQFDKSVPVFEQLALNMTELVGRDHPNTLMTLTNLGVNLKDSGQLNQALPLLEEGYQKGKPYSWVQATAGPQLLDAYAQAGQKADVIRLAGELVKATRLQVPDASPQLAGELVSLGQTLLKAEAFAEAEPLLRECLTIREKSLPDSWLTANAKSLVGAALLNQKKHTEAKPLLLAGYEEMQQREQTMQPENRVRLVEALERLVQVLDALNSTDEAKLRKDELDALRTELAR